MAFKFTKLLFIVFKLLICLCTVNFYCTTKPPITLGVSLPLTGDVKNYGTQFISGTHLYIDHINANGGVHGHPVHFIVKDDHYSPKETLKNTVSFLEDQDISFLYGYTGTPTTFKIMPLLIDFNKKSTILFLPSTASSVIRKSMYQPYVFYMGMPNNEIGSRVVDYFIENGKKRISVFYQLDLFGRDGWEGVVETLIKHNLPLVSEATYRRKDGYNNSYNEAVQHILSGNPDAIISFSTYTAEAGFIRDLRKFNTSIPVFGLNPGVIPFIIDQAPTNIDTLFDNLIVGSIVPDQRIPVPASKEFYSLSNATIEHNDDTPSSYEGFLSAKLLVQFLLKLYDPNNPISSPSDITAINERLKGTYDIGLGYPINYDSTASSGYNLLYFYTIQDKKLVLTKELLDD